MKQGMILLIGLLICSCLNNIKESTKEPLIKKSKKIYNPITQTHTKIKKNKKVKLSYCDVLVDSLLNQYDLCEKSYVQFLNVRSTYCETELYNILMDKCIKRYRKTFNVLEYEKLECIVKYTDGALSEYAGLVLKNLFLDYPEKLSYNIFQYEIDNDTSYVKSLIIMEASNFSENGVLNKSIKRFLFKKIE